MRNEYIREFLRRRSENLIKSYFGPLRPGLFPGNSYFYGQQSLYESPGQLNLVQSLK